jgi:hypothetical protein
MIALSVHGEVFSHGSSSSIHIETVIVFLYYYYYLSLLLFDQNLIRETMEKDDQNEFLAKIHAVYEQLGRYVLNPEFTSRSISNVMVKYGKTPIDVRMVINIIEDMRRAIELSSNLMTATSRSAAEGISSFTEEDIELLPRSVRQLFISTNELNMLRRALRDEQLLKETDDRSFAEIIVDQIESTRIRNNLITTLQKALKAEKARNEILQTELEETQKQARSKLSRSDDFLPPPKKGQQGKKQSPSSSTRREDDCQERVNALVVRLNREEERNDALEEELDKERRSFQNLSKEYNTFAVNARAREREDAHLLNNEERLRQSLYLGEFLHVFTDHVLYKLLYDSGPLPPANQHIPNTLLELNNRITFGGDDDDDADEFDEADREWWEQVKDAWHLLDTSLREKYGFGLNALTQESIRLLREIRNPIAHPDLNPSSKHSLVKLITWLRIITNSEEEEEEEGRESSPQTRSLIKWLDDDIIGNWPAALASARQLKQMRHNNAFLY